MDNNSAVVAQEGSVATPAVPQSQTQGSVTPPGSSTGTGEQTAQTSTPSYDPKEVETWRKKAQDHETFVSWVNQDAEILKFLDDKANGRIPGQAVQAPQGQQNIPVAPQSVDPVVNHPAFRQMQTQLQSLQREKIREMNEREISNLQEKYSFLQGDQGRQKLDEAYQKYGQEKLDELVKRGVPLNEAVRQTDVIRSEMPLDYFVTKYFPTELQDFLVKSKNDAGTLPAGIGSRGDGLMKRPGIQPAFEERAQSAFNEAMKTQNWDQLTRVVVEVTKQLGMDPNNQEQLFKVKQALRTGKLQNLGG